MAIFKIETDSGGAKFDAVKLGDSSLLNPGQKVFAVGNALAQYPNTVSAGIISAIARNVAAYNEPGGPITNFSGLIQTDVAINFGNSGGPLFNLAGEVIGMNVALAEYGNNISFAMPINVLKPVIESVLEHGEIFRPVMGVRFVMLDEEQASTLA